LVGHPISHQLSPWIVAPKINELTNGTLRLDADSKFLASSPVKVSIDTTACQGTGYCARLAPDVFEVVDSVAVVKVAVIAPELEKIVYEAEVLCPARAILVTD
jgi:ferredoxin